LEFGVSGRLWKNAFIMFDRQTDTFWSHITGESVDGPLKGKTLKVASQVSTIPRIRFGDWKKQFPESKVLSVNGRSEGQNRYVGYMMQPVVGIGTSAPVDDQRMPHKDLILGITTGKGALAYPLETFPANHILLDKKAPEPVLVFFDASSGAAAAYEPRVGEISLEFESKLKDFKVVDTTTGSTWNLLLGEAVEGTLKGKRLPVHPVKEIYWGAWVDYYPKTYLYDSGIEKKETKIDGGKDE